MNPLSVLGLFGAGLIVSIGTSWAIIRGANDFAVFHEAWRLVATGHAQDIYRATPDRFLYAPGFAWILSPLGLLPRSFALILWCFGKAAVVGVMIRIFADRLRSIQKQPLISAWGVASLAVFLIARPLLIDFQYGQVNVFILAACVWAIVLRFDASKPSSWDFIRWAVLGFASIAKIYPLPLLVIPYLVVRGIPKKRLYLERAGTQMGIAIAILSPIITEGPTGLMTLLGSWKEAILDRGFPTETHNQSIAAALHRWLSGDPVHVIARGMDPVTLGPQILSASQLGALAMLWGLVGFGFLLVWLKRSGRVAPLRWSAIMVGLLLLPLHLVWKPYFVLAYPLSVIAVMDAARYLKERQSIRRILILVAVFVLMNLTSIDVVGPVVAGALEAASVMMLAHLCLLGVTGFSSSS